MDTGGISVAAWKTWSFSAAGSWQDSRVGWNNDSYAPELREAINSQHFKNHDQTMRSKKLFHLLRQNFTGYSKIEN